MLIGLGADSNTVAIAQAIAQAEGGLTPGTFPYRTNNPCDVFVGGSTAGYSTMDAGWNACYNQIGLMLGGQSKVYTPDESISSIAASWAPASAGNDPNAWAANVAAALGLSPSDSLQAVAGNPSGSPTGLLDANTGGFDLSTLFQSSDDSGQLNLSLLDSDGNLTSWGWAAIAAVGVGALLLAAG